MATITSKGQITIPCAIRKALGLNVHDRVDFELKNDRVILTHNRQSLMDLYGIAGTHRKPHDKGTMRKAAESDLIARWNKKNKIRTA